MNFKKLDINTHDLSKVSKWIYETELEIFLPLIGKKELEAIENIKKLIKSKNNVFSHENIHVATDEDENVLGILVAFTGTDVSYGGELRAYYNILDTISFINFLIKGTLIDKWLTSSAGKEDYYLSNIAVDSNYRGQGIGSFIIENAFEIAKKRGCKRIILDVTFKNGDAKRLYECIGFKISVKNANRFIWADKGTYGMEYFL